MPNRSWDWLIVGGCPRSGTTFFTLMLNSHPGIRLTINTNLTRTLSRFESLFGMETFAARNKMERLLSKRENQDPAETLKYIPRFERSAGSLLETLFVSTFEGRYDPASLRYLGDKSNRYHYEGFDRLAKICEPLKVIHLSRNPLDVVSSMLWRSQNAKRGKDWWDAEVEIKQAVFDWACAWNFVGKVINEARAEILHLKYEDLVFDTTAQLDKVAAFLKVENQFTVGDIRREHHGERPCVGKRETEKIRKWLGPLDQNWDWPLEKLLAEYPHLPYGGKRPRALWSNLKRLSKKIAASSGTFRDSLGGNPFGRHSP